MAKSDVVLQLGVNAKAANASLDKFENKLKGVDDTSQKTGTSLKSMVGIAAGAAAAVAAVGAGLGFAVKSAIEIEELTTSFVAFTGSVESAEDQIEKLAEFSANTPFKLKDLAEANRTLLAFGSSSEESLVQLQQLGDAAAATGKPIGELALIFGQVQSAGKLTGERFLQLAERGINIGPIIAKSLGVAETSLRDLISAGKVSSEEVTKAFATLSGEGGKFAGATLRQSQTLGGALGTLEDNVTLLAASFGKTLSPSIVGYVDDLTNAIKVTGEFFKQIDERENLSKAARDAETLALQLEVLVEKREDLVQPGGFFSGLFQVQDTGEALKEVDARIRATTEAIRENNKVLAERDSGVRLASEQVKAEEARTETLKKSAAEELAANAKVEEARLAKVENVKKIEEQITQIEAQERAVRDEANLQAAQIGNEAALEALVLREEQLAEKRIELEAQKLEAEGQFQEAAKLRATELEDLKQAQLTATAKKGEADRIAAIRQAQNDEFNIAKAGADATIAFDEQTYAQRVQTANKGLSALAGLQQSSNRTAFEIGKAAAIAQAAIAIPITAIEAYKSLAGIPLVGPALGAAAAAAAIITGTQRLNQIRAQQPTGFAEGGQVPPGFDNDSFPALLTSGEVVVPERNFEQLISGGLDPRNDEQILVLRQILFGVNRLVELNNILINSVETLSFNSGSSAGSNNNADFLNNLLEELQRDQPTEQGRVEETVVRTPGGIGRDRATRNGPMQEQTR